ncbi:hypothetical protein ACP4OV_023696 [Aristida adscensionis]
MNASARVVESNPGCLRMEVCGLVHTIEEIDEANKITDCWVIETKLDCGTRWKTKPGNGTQLQ